MATSSNFPKDIEALRLLRTRQVVELIGLSTSRIRQLEEMGQFPKRLALGSHVVAWRATDIRDWVEQRVAVGVHAGKGVTAKQAPAALPEQPAAKKRATAKSGGR